MQQTGQEALPPASTMERHGSTVLGRESAAVEGVGRGKATAALCGGGGVGHGAVGDVRDKPSVPAEAAVAPTAQPSSG